MVAIKLANSDEFSGLIRQMNQLVDSTLGRQFFGGFSPTDAWRPSVNLYESEAAFLVCVDLAGMEQSQIEVQVDKGHLVVRGRRQSPVPPEGEKAIAVHLMEIDHGTFCRTLEIPASVAEKKIAATYTQGMLWITLPKSSDQAKKK
jgi:HSP20 family protein